MNHKTTWIFGLISLVLISTCGNVWGSWMQYATTSEAGGSNEKLKTAEEFAGKIGTAAYLLADKTTAIAVYGDCSRRYMLQSVRKSLLSALLGMAVTRGQLDLKQTMADLQIDDLNPLTEQEKKATVRDLLMSRSGIYHPAAFENAGWKAAKPQRGSHAAGDSWYYNNWDFNALLTVYEQATGGKIFEDFDTIIAQPLQMQDYEPRFGAYFVERDVSRHPAYLFRMSARDLARFGQLYLNKGIWNGKKLLDPDWIRESTRPLSPTTSGDSYGYLWWAFREESPFRGGYYANGAGAQMVIILPKLDLVFVHLADTYSDKDVSQDDVLTLLDLLIHAKGSEKRTGTVPLDYPDQASIKPSDPGLYADDYRYADGRSIRIMEGDGELFMNFGFGDFSLSALSETRFAIIDSQEIVEFMIAEDGSRRLNYKAAKRNPMSRKSEEWAIAEHASGSSLKAD